MSGIVRSIIAGSSFDLPECFSPRNRIFCVLEWLAIPFRAPRSLEIAVAASVVSEWACWQHGGGCRGVAKLKYLEVQSTWQLVARPSVTGVLIDSKKYVPTTVRHRLIVGFKAFVCKIVIWKLRIDVPYIISWRARRSVFCGFLAKILRL